jgi:hypothetical protein
MLPVGVWNLEFGVRIWHVLCSFLALMSAEIDKPSLATGMAKRGFWIGAGAGVAVGLLRFDLFDDRLKAVLVLLAFPAALVALIFGLVALVRITSADRQNVLVPALCAVGLAIYSNVSLGHWAKSGWAKARAHARAVPVQDQPLFVNARAVNASAPTPIKSIVRYELPDFDAIPERAAQIKVDAMKVKGEDAAVLRAWAAHLERLYAVYTNTCAASNTLHQIDLLDPKAVSNFNDSEAVRRRGLANQYADAWHKLSDALFTFSGSYYQDMAKEVISPTRTSNEGNAIFAFVSRPEIAERINVLRRLCEAEEKVGRYYNYAVSCVFDYARLSRQAPNASGSFRQRMDDQVRELADVQRAASFARQEAADLAGKR